MHIDAFLAPRTDIVLHGAILFQGIFRLGAIWEVFLGSKRPDMRLGWGQRYPKICMRRGVIAFLGNRLDRKTFGIISANNRMRVLTRGNFRCVRCLDAQGAFCNLKSPLHRQYSTLPFVVYYDLRQGNS